MKGKHFRVRSKRIVFEFSVEQPVVVLKGDSATGKTVLLRMLYEFLRVGRRSGYSVETDADYFVYLRKEVGHDWKDELLGLHDTVVFIEENNDFVFSSEFLDFVKKSGNSFVIVNRASIKDLQYSTFEIVRENDISVFKEIKSSENPAELYEELVGCTDDMMVW
jgi:vacuolar-type H+-ATPase subunit F/Vma7